MSYTPLNWLLAAFPVFSFIVAMIVFKQSGNQSAALSWLAALISAFLFFGADFAFFLNTLAKGLLLAFDVLLIIWAALFFYMVTDRAGTIQILGNWISRFSDNRAVKGLFLGWLFPSFLQGMGGFGVPVAVSAPLLVSSGFNPIQALVMASVGHSWAITFGSMSASFQVLMAASSLSGKLLAPYSSLFLGICVLFCGFFVAHIADGVKGIRSTLWLILILSVIMGGGLYLFSVNGLWIISVTIPALLAMIIGYFLVKQHKHAKDNASLTNQEKNRYSLTVIPYIVLVLTTIMVTIIEPIKETLDKFTFTIFFPEITTRMGYITPAGPGRGIHTLNHPGLIICISALISYAVFCHKGLLSKNDFIKIIRSTAAKSKETTLTLLFMGSMAAIMSHTHMTGILAEGVSQFFGSDLYPIAAPFIGALGAFITGNNSNSNLLFTALQMQSAELAGLSIPLVLAAQTAGASIGSMMAPAKVVLGCATVGLHKQEGSVISKIFFYGILLILLIGVLSMLLSRYGIIISPQ